MIQCHPGNGIILSNFRRYFAYYILLFLTLFYWFPLLIFQTTLFFGHIPSQYYPYTVLLKKSFAGLQFPLWNPYILSGVPFFANMQAGVLYPLNIIFVLLPFAAACNISIILHTYLAAVFMFKFLKSYKYDMYSCIYGALLFAFNGFFIMRVEFFSQFFSYIWIPLILYTFRKYIVENKRHYLLTTAFFLAVQFFSGYPQFSLFTIILLIVFSFSNDFAVPGLKKRFMDIALGAVFFVLLISIQLLPVIELMLSSARGEGMDYADIVMFSLHPLDFLKFTFLPVWTMLSPKTYGDPHIVGNYIGIISLVPIINYIFRRVKDFRRVSILEFVLLVALLMSFGKYIPGHEYLLQIMPFNRWFRFPAQWMIVFVFCMAIICAEGIKNLKEGIKIFMVIVLFLELFLFGKSTYGTIKKEYFKAKFPNIEFLSKDKSLFRYMLNPDAQMAAYDRDGENFVDWDLYANKLYPNTSMIYGFFDAGGYEQLTFRDYEKILECIKINPRTRWVDMLNIKYLFSHREVKIDGFERIESANDMFIYKNEGFLPRIYFVNKVKYLSREKIIHYVDSRDFNPGKEVIIEEKYRNELKYSDCRAAAKYQIAGIAYELNGISFNIKTNGDGIVVLSEAWDRGWRARVNNKKAKIIPVNYCFRGVKVPKGESAVVLHYKPYTYAAGAYATVTALIIYLLVILGGKDRKTNIGEMSS